MVKIIADSSADIKAVEGVCFQSVPMTIRAGGRDFVDNEQLDTAAMLDFLASHNGPSGTACPGPENWMSAFEGADEIFVVCITGSLSGTWSSAMAARELYLQAHPDVKIHVFDSLSTGPEMLLLIEKLASLIREGKSFDEICAAGEEYLSSTHLLFILRSVHNLAQNGRVSKLVAGAIGILGIQILGVVGGCPHGAVGKHRSAFERAAQRSGGGKPVALFVPVYAERIAHRFNKNVTRGPRCGSPAGMTAHTVTDDAKRCRADRIYAEAVLIFNPF